MNSLSILQKPLYSPIQVAVGTFFGGPLAMIFLLWENFTSMDKPRGAQITLAAGLFFCIGLFVLGLKAPEDKLMWIMFAAQCLYTIVAVQIAATCHRTKAEIQQDGQYCFQPLLRVVIVSILFFILWYLVLQYCSDWLSSMGIID